MPPQSPPIDETAQGYRCTWDDGVGIAIEAIVALKHHHLDALVTTSLNGAALYQARVKLLDQQDLYRYTQTLAAQNGQVAWLPRLQYLIRGVLIAEARVDDVDETSSPAADMPAEPFPVAVLPTPVQRLVIEGARALPCAPDLIAIPALAAMGVAIGAGHVLEIKPGWQEGAQHYSAVVADPGQKKSPADDLALAPVRQRQRQYYESWKQATATYDADLSTYKEELAEWQSDKQAGLKVGKKPKPPQEPELLKQIWVDDTTLEALAEILDTNPRGVVLARDELTGWVHGMNQYKGGKGADRQAWLSFWTCKPHIVNRKGRKGPLYLQRPFVCVTGGLPPDVLSDLCDERSREDGFIHRIVFAFPDPVPLIYTDDVVSSSTRDSYAALIDKLFALPNADVDDQPVVLTLTAKARDTWKQSVQENIYDVLNDPSCPVSLKGPLAKLEGYTARFALIIHLARRAAGEKIPERQVDEQSVVAAAALVHYFREHARRVFARLQVDPIDQQVTTAMDWIRKHGNLVTAREMQMHRVGGVKSSTEAKALLRTLEDRGLGKVSEGRKNTMTFTLR
jgi:hypothetical protein